jgi:Transglutaminase-like superfamily
MTAVGRHTALVEALPSDLDGLVRVTQGLIIYDAVASEFYGCELSEERRRAIHIRPVEEVLDGILALDPRPLSAARPPDRRLAGRCDHYARLLVAVLRAKGVPARVRCGFAAYFNPGYFEDHMVCERWSAGERRWVLVDPQFDVEVLPWDVWGAQPQPDQTLQEDQLAFFDELAALVRDPDDSFDELRERYEADGRLQVPTTVFNAILGRAEERLSCAPGRRGGSRAGAGGGSRPPPPGRPGG